MSLIKVGTVGFLLLVSAAASGCAAPFESSETIETVAEGSGLTFDTRTAQHVAGRFTHDGAVLVFDFQKKATHARRRSSEAGAPLLRASLSADGVESLVLFGGRAKVSGAPASYVVHGSLTGSPWRGALPLDATRSQPSRAIVRPSTSSQRWLR